MVRDLCMFAGFNEDSRIVWFKITYSKGPGSLSAITDFLEKEMHTSSSGILTILRSTLESTQYLRS